MSPDRDLILLPEDRFPQLPGQHTGFLHQQGNRPLLHMKIQIQTHILLKIAPLHRLDGIRYPPGAVVKGSRLPARRTLRKVQMLDAGPQIVGDKGLRHQIKTVVQIHFPVCRPGSHIRQRFSSGVCQYPALRVRHRSLHSQTVSRRKARNGDQRRAVTAVLALHIGVVAEQHLGRQHVLSRHKNTQKHRWFHSSDGSGRLCRGPDCTAVPLTQRR